MANPHDQTAWMILLQRARLIGDTALEQRARDELEQLGVRVTYLPSVRRKPAASQRKEAAR